jgi:hypothetical protein
MRFGDVLNLFKSLWEAAAQKAEGSTPDTGQIGQVIEKNILSAV